MRTYKENAELFFKYLSNYSGQLYLDEIGDDVVIVLSNQSGRKEFIFTSNGKVQIYAEENGTIDIPGNPQYTDTIDTTYIDFNKFCDWYSSGPQTSYGRFLFSGCGSTEDVLNLKENN